MPRDKLPGTLKLDKVEALRTAWVEQGGTNIKGAADAAGVRWETAERYLLHGDLERGIEPIHKWYVETYMPEHNVLLAKSFAERAAENLDMIDVLKSATFQRLIDRLVPHKGKDGKVVEADYEANLTEMTRLMQQEFRWAGGGIWEQQALQSFLGVVMLTVAKVLRRHGMDEQIQGIIEELAVEFRPLAAQGVRGVIGDGR